MDKNFTRDDNEFVNNPSGLIDGQICYDELLSRAKPENQIEERIMENKIDGQLGLDELNMDGINSVPADSEDLKEEVLEECELSQEEENEAISADEKQMLKDILQKNKEDRKKFAGDGEDGLIVKSLEDVLHDSMVPYTEHVVLDRALPRVEDGLKPVQRRILYSMMELGVTPDKPYRKSARIVGDCMGKYHPHGDSSVYDAMVRLSQDFCMSAPLVDGHGNFGSIDGDGAAAMRYTEARLQPLAMELLRDLEKNTVRWGLNFDDTLKEPDILPGRFPNLLVNGASGIAVGLATNIPPHNLGEVIDGVIAYIDNPKIKLDEMMKYIPAPDFPTGGYITAGEEAVNAYQTGKGKIIMRSKVHLESRGDKKELIITEMPYMTNKAALLQKIAELKANGDTPLNDVMEIRDESDRNGMRAVIKLKKDANPKKILEYLYKRTGLQTSFAINIVAIADGKPKLMGLLDIISYYVEYQREIIYNRTKFDLDVAKDRAHIVEGLLIAIKNIDEVIRIIKKASTSAEAKTKLRERFLLSDKQAQAILDMRLARLVNLEVVKLETELEELKKQIAKLTEILASKKMQYGIVKSELKDIKNRYAVPRRSEIIDSLEIKHIKEEDEEVAEKKIIIGVTANNYVKSIGTKNFNLAQKEITDNSSLNDIHKFLVTADSRSKVLFVLENGYIVKLVANKIPDSKWREKGTLIKMLESNASKDDKIVSVIVLPIEVKDEQIIFMTKRGFVKRSNLEEYDINKGYYQGIKLKDGDAVLNATINTNSGSLLMISSGGNALNMSKTDIPVQGRISSGVIGMNIEEQEELVCADLIEPSSNAFIITNKGFAKVVALNEFEIMPRNRKGIRITSLGENGKRLIFGSVLKDKASVAVNLAGDVLKEIEIAKQPIEARYSKGVQLIKAPIISCYDYNR